MINYIFCDNNKAWKNVIRFTGTVPDRVLEKTRYSKLGVAVKGPSVEEPPIKAKENSSLPLNRDYK